MQQIKVLNISESIRNRANSLCPLLDFRKHKYSDLLCLISTNGYMAAIGEDYVKAGWSKNSSDKAFDFERKNQSKLIKAGITDDASAIAFLDKVEPQVRRWDQEWRVLLMRQESEKEVYLVDLK